MTGQPPTQPAEGPVTFELTYWVPVRYSLILDAAEVAAKLRAAGWPQAAAVADRIARGEQLDANDAAEEDDGPLGALACALRKNAALFDAEVGHGAPTGCDDPETYHVWLDLDRGPAVIAVSPRQPLT